MFTDRHAALSNYSYVREEDDTKWSYITNYVIKVICKQQATLEGHFKTKYAFRIYWNLLETDSVVSDRKKKIIF